MNTSAIISRSAALLAGLMTLATGVLAQPGPPPEKCVSLNRIKRTEIIDDRHIIFYMRSGEIFKNQLTNRCVGLRPRETIMYRPSINRLCSLDFITVLRRTGFGFTQGPSCGLGEFYPTDEFAVAKLKEQAEIQRKLRRKKRTE